MRRKRFRPEATQRLVRSARSGVYCPSVCCSDRTGDFQHGAGEGLSLIFIHWSGGVKT